MLIVYIFIAIIFLALALVSYEFYKKNVHIWIFNYLFRRKQKTDKPIHVMFAFVDHYEPMWGKASYDQEVTRVDQWLHQYPEQVKGHYDADGKSPQHTYFYPQEEYRVEHLNKIASLCKSGYGEVEIHLHHDNDTEDNFMKTMQGFLETLDKNHGLIPKNENGYQFSFIHGNWSLDNSRKDGRWCGLNNELILLKKLGCYADYTLPSAPSDTQTKKVNSIYYAKDNPVKPKSHNTGIDVCVGGKESGDLMIIQGPLSFNFKSRKYGVLPKIENADIRSIQLPTNDRVDLWVDQHISVQGKPDWIFIKIHTHGTQETDIDAILGDEVEKMYSYLETKYNDGENYVLHYVTAREMYNIIKAAENNEAGSPNDYRDYIIDKPPILKQ